MFIITPHCFQLADLANAALTPVVGIRWSDPKPRLAASSSRAENSQTTLRVYGANLCRVGKWLGQGSVGKMDGQP